MGRRELGTALDGLSMERILEKRDRLIIIAAMGNNVLRMTQDGQSAKFSREKLPEHYSSNASTTKVSEFNNLINTKISRSVKWAILPQIRKQNFSRWLLWIWLL